MPLYETVRPKSLDGVVGQPKAVAACKRIIAGGCGGNAVWITGPTGMGKTTLAKILAGSMPEGTRVSEYRTAADLNPDELSAIDRAYEFNRRGLLVTRWAVIVNEAHLLSKKQIGALLGLLEPVPESFLWVFTTTWAGQSWLEDNALDAAPLMGRCWSGAPIRLTNQGMAKAAAELVRDIAVKHNLDGQPIEEYIKLANRHAGSVRGMLQAVEAGEMIR